MWTVAGAVLAITVLGERRPLSSVGLRRPSMRLLATGVGIGVGLSLMVPLVVVVVTAAGGEASDVTDVAAQTGPGLLALGVLTSAVTEEINFRGSCSTA
jgi:membrane protease YdiL (CAAX protease family)